MKTCRIALSVNLSEKHAQTRYNTKISTVLDFKKKTIYLRANTKKVLSQGKPGISKYSF